MGARVQNGITGSYMDAVLELVALEELEIGTCLPHSFVKEGYLQLVSRVCVASV